MQKIFFLSILLFICQSVSAQWTLLEGTEDWTIADLEATGDYLILNLSASDTTAMRYNLLDASSEIMLSPSGVQFSRFEDREIAAIGEHVLYVANDTIYRSHDAGGTWEKVLGLVYLGSNNYITYDSTFVLGISRSLLLSSDFGNTFDLRHRESFYTTNLRPMLVQSDSIYLTFPPNDGLFVMPLENTGYRRRLSNLPFWPRSVAMAGDTMWATFSNELYTSYDRGRNWLPPTIPSARGNALRSLHFKDGLLFADSWSEGILVSTDYGTNFTRLDEGMPTDITIIKLILAEQKMYVTTTSGVYEYTLSDLIPKQVTGQVFYDENLNGIKDENEMGLPYQNLRLTNRSSTYLTDENGRFSIQYFGDNMDTLQYLPAHPHYVVDTPVVYIENPTSSIDFPVQMDASVISTNLSIAPYSNARPGFEVQYGININNGGANTVVTTLRLELDPNLTFLSSNVPDFSFSEGRFDVSLSLEPFERKLVNIQCALPADIDLLDDTLGIFGQILPFSDDILPEDNMDTLRQVITGSYDPNDKLVAPESCIFPSFIENKEALDYVIRFQNTGTDTAFTVKIEDRLDEHLDVNSFEFIGASHDCQVSIDADNLLVFDFQNIMLPDSNVNLVASQGFVHYTIQPKTNLPLNESILNTASIFFDFNPAIITNTTSTLYKLPLTSSVHDVPNYREGNELIIFPNPTNGRFSIVRDGTQQQLEIYSIRGQKVKSLRFGKAQSLEVDIQDLADGIYFVKLIDDLGYFKLGKIMKLRAQ